MNANQAIDNLNLISAALGKAANKPENYNSDWAYYLEQMSFEMHKQAAQLKFIADYYDLPNSLDS